MSESIKLFVDTTEDNASVVLVSEYERGGDKDVRNYLLPPETAVNIANSMLHAAERCGVEIQVQSNRHISDMQRLQLIARTGHIMRTMSGKKADRISLQIVDSILAEIL